MANEGFSIAAAMAWGRDENPDSDKADGALICAVHATVPGRVRFRAECLKREPDITAAVELALGRRRGIERATANPITGSILIVYADGQSIERITSIVGEAVSTALRHGGDGASPSRPENGAPARYARRQTAEDLLVTGRHRLLEMFGSSEARGLASADVSARRARYGENRLPGMERRSRLGILLAQFTSVPVAMLGASAVLSLATGGLLEAVAIVAVIGANAFVGYQTENAVEETVDALRQLTRPPTLVLRDGEITKVETTDVVPGDLLVLKPGRFVAADARLIKANNLTVDESALTGESLPVAKQATALKRRDVPIAERANMVFMDTVVTGGNGLALVVGTGSYTEIGTIQRLVGEALAPQTPLQGQLDDLGRQLAFYSLLLCGGVFAIGLLRGYGFLSMLRFAVSLGVAAIPEGLPAVATTTLSLGVGKMRDRDVLVRRLGAIETIGAVQVMCLDKTGTLTCNAMTVTSVETEGARFEIAGEQLTAEGADVENARSHELPRLARIVALCNEASIESNGAIPGVRGSSTETALLALAEKLDLDVEALRHEWPDVTVNHRSERRQLMSTVHVGPNGRHLVAVKGNPEEVLNRCNTRQTGARTEPLSDGARQAIRAANQRMGGEALRVLGVAYADLGADEEPGNRIEHDLTWIGLVGMSDPIRSGVSELISRFHTAQIKPVMITGDQSSAATAVGEALDLAHGAPLHVMEAGELDRADDGSRPDIGQADVFARVSPQDKLKIVQRLQESRYLVAMTGDGVNDGPAMRAADIGVAMGQSGTEVARSVADVVLVRDDLAAMIDAIALGRTTYDNIRKAIRYLVSTNVSEIGLTTAAITLGLGQPLTPMQLLWINLITDVAPALGLAMEPPEPDVMRRPPRDARAPVLDRQDLRQVGIQSAALTTAALGAYGFGLVRYGRGPRAGTLAFTTLVVGQLVHALSSRSDHHGLFSYDQPAPNPILFKSVIGSLALQAAALFFPPLRRLLGTAPLGLIDLGVVGCAALGPLLVTELSKRQAGPNKTD